MRAPPAESQEVYLPATVFGMAVHCAQVFGLSIDELATEAMIEHLKTKAGELFERELQEAKMEADRSNGITLKRYEFEKTWRPPYWATEVRKPPTPE